MRQESDEGDGDEEDDGKNLYDEDPDDDLDF